MTEGKRGRKRKKEREIKKERKKREREKVGRRVQSRQGVLLLLPT